MLACVADEIQPQGFDYVCDAGSLCVHGTNFQRFSQNCPKQNTETFFTKKYDKLSRHKSVFSYKRQGEKACANCKCFINTQRGFVVTNVSKIKS